MEGICRDSLKQFKRTDQKCSYLNEKSGSRCVNTKEGHSKGHQDARGNFLANGPFDHGDFTSREFLAAIKFEVHCILHEPKMVPLDLTGFLAQQQQDLLRARGTQKPLPHSRNPQPGHDCPLCIFGRPEYALPCGHHIFAHCLVEFAESGDDSGSTTGEGYVVHLRCPHGPLPFDTPYRVPIRPGSSGLRMLCLDGGGVRGVVQLITLRKVEDLICLGLPIWQFFDPLLGQAQVRCLVVSSLTASLSHKTDSLKRL